MTAISIDIKHFMGACERLFGFAHRNGGLTVEEGEIIGFYVNELQTHFQRDSSRSWETDSRGMDNRRETRTEP